MENMMTLLVMVLVAALGGAGATWLVLQRKLKQMQGRMQKYEQLRKQLEQQKTQAFKQIEQLQADLTDLRREQALHDAPRGKPAQAASTPVGPACRVCERVGCLARAEPPVTRPLGLDEMATGLSAFDFQ